MIHAVPEHIATGWINYRIFMSPVVYTVFINVSFHNKTIVVTCRVNTCIVYNSPTIYVYMFREHLLCQCVCIVQFVFYLFSCILKSIHLIWVFFNVFLHWIRRIILPVCAIVFFLFNSICGKLLEICCDCSSDHCNK